MDKTNIQKRLGQFYTPTEIVDFILRWGFEQKINNILEPSCGDGIFLQGLKTNQYKYQSITAIEIDETEYKKAADTKLKNLEIINTDFLSFCNKTEKKFDLIIGNPPYVSHVATSSAQREEALKIFKKAKVDYPKVNNMWAWFVIGCSMLLTDKGKLGLVLPIDLFQVSYASVIRKFLQKYFKQTTIITFNKEVFSNTHQEAVILLCEKEHKTYHKNVRDKSKLDNIKSIGSEFQKVDLYKHKWAYYALNKNEVDFLEYLERSKINRLDTLSNVVPGLETPANEYFAISEHIRQEYDLQEYTIPLYGKGHINKGLDFLKSDWFDKLQTNAQSYLLQLPPAEKLNNPKHIKYLKLGVSLNIPLKKELQRKQDWQVLSNLVRPTIILNKIAHSHAQMQFNPESMAITDSKYGLLIGNEIDPHAFVVSFYNSLSMAFGEIYGKVRTGKFLVLNIRQLRQIPINYRKEHSIYFDEINTLMRNGTDIEELISITDKFTLSKNFTLEEITLLNSIWIKLRTKRLNTY